MQYNGNAISIYASRFLLVDAIHHCVGKIEF